MSLSTKLKVVIAFACRLLLIPPSATRLPILHASIYSAHPAAYTVKLQVMSLLACQVSVISATVPCAKPFFSVFASGNLGRAPRDSILPVQRPTMRREESGGTLFSRRTRVDREGSIDRLHLRPHRRTHFANAQHVPDPPPPPPQTERAQRPSLVNSKQSSLSITYLREFEVTFEEAGGRVSETTQISTRVTVEANGRGSSAGFPWAGGRRSRRKSSQKSNGGSSQQASPSS